MPQFVFLSQLEQSWTLNSELDFKLGAENLAGAYFNSGLSSFIGPKSYKHFVRIQGWVKPRIIILYVTQLDSLAACYRIKAPVASVCNSNAKEALSNRIMLPCCPASVRRFPVLPMTRFPPLQLTFNCDLDTFPHFSTSSDVKAYQMDLRSSAFKSMSETSGVRSAAYMTRRCAAVAFTQRRGRKKPNKMWGRVQRLLCKLWRTIKSQM